MTGNLQGQLGLQPEDVNKGGSNRAAEGAKGAELVTKPGEKAVAKPREVVTKPGSKGADGRREAAEARRVAALQVRPSLRFCAHASP